MRLQRWRSAPTTPAYRADAAGNRRMRRELLGIGRDPLEKLEFLQHPARAFGYSTHGIVGDVNRQTGLLRHQPVDAAQ